LRCWKLTLTCRLPSPTTPFPSTQVSVGRLASVQGHCRRLPEIAKHTIGACKIDSPAWQLWERGGGALLSLIWGRSRSITCQSIRARCTSPPPPVAHSSAAMQTIKMPFNA
jgi:hypothetical protein